MSLKTLIVTSCAALSLLSACASTLQTKLEPERVNASVETVLKAQGFAVIDRREAGATWHLQADRTDTCDFQERTFVIEQAPTTRLDPIASNGNVTTFEERVDPSRFTTTARTETVRYHVDVSVGQTGSSRDVSVAVTGGKVPVSNKYREIVWKGAEPPSARKIEETIYRTLERDLQAQPQ